MNLRAALTMATLLGLGAAGAAVAAPVTGGNPVVELDGRDGADGITFIDLSHTISGDGRLTSWSFYADDWYGYTAPKQVKLVIFRDEGTQYRIVGQTAFVEVAEWDRPYSFSLPNLPVEEGDIVGWTYPTYPHDAWPGGVISYRSGTATNTRWTAWPNGEVTAATGSLVAKGLFAYGGEGRAYSIRVDGETNPVPEPGTLALLGTGLVGLAGAARRRRKG